MWSPGFSNPGHVEADRTRPRSLSRLRRIRRPDQRAGARDRSRRGLRAHDLVADVRAQQDHRPPSTAAPRASCQRIDEPRVRDVLASVDGELPRPVDLDGEGERISHTQSGASGKKGRSRPLRHAVLAPPARSGTRMSGPRLQLWLVEDPPAAGAPAAMVVGSAYSHAERRPRTNVGERAVATRAVRLDDLCHEVVGQLDQVLVRGGRSKRRHPRIGSIIHRRLAGEMPTRSNRFGPENAG